MKQTNTYTYYYSVNEFTSIFRNNIAGLQIIDISNINLGGSSALNYYLNSVFPINANIFKSPINAIFTASDKIYDKMTTRIMA